MDALSKHFRYNDSPARGVNHDPHSIQVYDKFGLFTDFDYKWDDATNRCEPMVKFYSSDKEDWSRLVSVDGVNANCFMDYQFGQQDDHS